MPYLNYYFKTITNNLYLDFDPPTLELTQYTSNATEITDGYVELYFTYADDYAGIWKVIIDWGDGIVQNVTDDNYAFHYFTKSGTYEVIIKAYDRGKNTFSLSLIYTITLPEVEPTEQVPFAFISTLIGIFVVGYVVFRLKRKK